LAVDGAKVIQKLQSDGTVNWTGTTSTVLEVAPNFDLFAIARAGGGGYQQPTSGTVDGTNQTYTWTTAPNAIVVDSGRIMQKISSDGTENWTGTLTTILSVAPNFDCFAVA
jgi:hypothetical protein